MSGLDTVSKLLAIKQAKTQTDLMQESLAGIQGKREAAQAAYTPAKTDETTGQTTPGKFDPSSYEDQLYQRGFAEEAENYKAAQSKATYEGFKAQAAQSSAQMEGMTSGLYQIKAGDVNGGLQTINQYLPKGQRILSAKPTGKEGMYLVKREGDNQGQVMSIHDLDMAATDSKTRLQIQNAIKLKQMEESTKKTLKANEFMAPNGTIWNMNGLVKYYQTQYNIMDPKDLLLLKQSDPDKYQQQVAWQAQAPKFEEWMPKTFGQEFADKVHGQSMNIPESTMAEYRQRWPDKTDKEIRDAVATFIQNKGK